MLAISADSEALRALEILFPRAGDGGVVQADVQQVHAGAVFVIEAADVGAGSVGFHHDSDAVQLVMAGMKDVTHRQTVAAQYLSNAAVRFAAMSCGDRPSI